MSYSNRPSRRPDPTVAPITRNPFTGEVGLREPFTPSAYTEAKFKASKAGQKRARRQQILQDRYGR